MPPPPPLFDELWFRLLAGLFVGLSLGSFATMLSFRLPQKMSIVKPGSFCPSCTTPLGIRDLFPVLSWVSSGGKCRHCGVRIGARYPLIELATGAASAASFALIGFRPVLALALAAITGIVTGLTIAIERKGRNV